MEGVRTENPYFTERQFQYTLWNKKQSKTRCLLCFSFLGFSFRRRQVSKRPPKQGLRTRQPTHKIQQYRMLAWIICVLLRILRSTETSSPLYTAGTSQATPATHKILLSEIKARIWDVNLKTWSCSNSGRFLLVWMIHCKLAHEPLTRAVMAFTSPCWGWSFRICSDSWMHLIRDYEQTFGYPILLHFPGSKLSVLNRGPAVCPTCLSLYLLVWSPRSSLTLCCFVCLLELLFLPVTLSLLTSSGCGGLAPGFDISARSSIDRFASSISNLCRMYYCQNQAKEAAEWCTRCSSYA